MGVANDPFDAKPSKPKSSHREGSKERAEVPPSSEEESDDESDMNRNWHKHRKWQPFPTHWEHDDAKANILRPAFEQMIRAPEDHLTKLSPLDMHTLRKAMTYMMLHRYDIEEQLVDLETTSDSITKHEWRTMWRNVARESAVEDKRAAERAYPTTGSMFAFLSQAPILTLDQLTSKQSNEMARIERDTTMRRIFKLFQNEHETFNKVDGDESEDSHDGGEDCIPIQQLRLYLNPAKRYKGSELFKKIRTQAAAELLRQQTKACSIEMSTNNLKRFFGTLLPSSTQPDATGTKMIKLVDDNVKSPNDHLSFLVSNNDMSKIRFGLDDDHGEKVWLELNRRTLCTLLGCDDNATLEDMWNDPEWTSHPEHESVDKILGRIYDDMRMISSCIVSDKAWEQFVGRLTTRAQVVGLAQTDIDYFKDIVGEYIITEDQFCEAYKNTFGVSPKNEPSVCTPGCDLWYVLDDTFNGAIEKKTFFTNLAKKPTIPADGLGYHMGYARRRYETTMRDMFFVLYIVFVMLLTFFLQSDKGIGPGYYLNVAIDENIGKDEIGDDTKYWFAQSFYDAVNEEEYWDWFKGPLLQSLYDSDDPAKAGTKHSFFYTNKLVGGIKLRQFRQAPRRCKGQQELFDSDTDICRAEGDPRKATDWKPITDQVLTSEMVTTQCLASGVLYDTRDPITLIVDDSREDYWEIYNAVAHVVSILIEEKYHARVNLFNASIAPPNVTTVITIGGGGDTELGTFQPGWFMTTAGANACPQCIAKGHTALNNVNNAQVFKSVILDKDGVDTEVAAKLVSNSLTLITRDGYDRKTYEEKILSQAANGDPLLFYDTSPGKLTGSFSSVRLELGDDYSSMPIMKGYNLDKNTYADVEQVMFHMALGKTDLDSILADLNNENMTTSACNWLTANKWQWYRWLRRDVEDDISSKRDMYHPKCYDSWDDSTQDEDGYQDSENLSPGILAANVIYTPKSIFNIDSDLETTDELLFSAPTKEEFNMWIDQAEGGNLTAETLWKRAQPWVYRSCSELGGARFLSYPGRMVSSGTQTMALYGCSGYGMILPIDMSYADIVHEVELLNSNGWIDVSTRGVMVEFFIHNQNSRLVSRFQYMAEIATTGGWAMSLQVHTFRLFQLESLAAPAVYIVAIVATILLMITLIYESIRSFRLAWKTRLVELRAEADQAHGSWCPPFTCNTRGISLGGLRLIGPWLGLYFSEFWYAFDTIFYGVVIVSWCFRFWFMYLGETDQNVACDRVFPDDYETASEVSYSLFQLDGVAILLAYMKFIYYLRSFSEINRIVMTVQRASLLIAYLLCIFVIFMMGFTLSAWVVFGTLVERYRGTGDAFGTLLLMMMGDIDFQLMTEARPGFSLTFFLLFYVVVITILFNLLIGVITSAFEEVYNERFDEDAFISRVAHDPASGAWDGERAFGVRQLVMENATVREVKYYFKKISYPVMRLLDKVQGTYDPDYRNSNPRKFWPRYLSVLQDLDSPDMHLVFRAHTQLKLLAKKYGASLDPSSGHEVVVDSGTKTYDLTAKPVLEFINESVGPARRPLIDFLLVEIPSRVMGLNKARAWHMVLNDHIVWKADVERWANFDLTADAEDVNNRCQELEYDVERLKEEFVEFEQQILDTLLTTNKQNIHTVLKDVFQWNDGDDGIDSEVGSEADSVVSIAPTPRFMQEESPPHGKE